MILDRFLRHLIRHGTLAVTFASGRQATFSGSEPGPEIAIKIADRATERRLFMNPDLILGEAFMDGTITVENGDIYDLLELCLMNLSWDLPDHWIQRLQGRLRRYRAIQPYR